MGIPSALEDDLFAANLDAGLAVTDAAPAADAQKFLGLQFPPDLQLLLPTQPLVEILPVTLPEMTPVPDSSQSIMGVYNWRGEVLWLVDLGYVLQQRPLFQTGYSQQSTYSLLVFQLHQQTIGLVVNQVAEIYAIQPDRVTPPSVVSHLSAIAPLFQGGYVLESARNGLLLDLDALVERILQA
jgi:positive phototaxis protein PixI